MSAASPAGTSGLYQVNLTTGTAAFIAPIPASAPVVSIAVDNTPSTADFLDFDGDRKSDLGVFRYSNNNWIIQNSSNGFVSTTNWGNSATDFLTPADFDGDAKTDIAVWRSTNGTFYVIRSSDNAIVVRNWGQQGDEPGSA